MGAQAMRALSRLRVRTTEDAKDTASSLVDWLHQLRCADGPHEIDKCTAEALQHARALEKWLADHEAEGCRTPGRLL